MIYLDNASTTKVHPKVLQRMFECLEEEYGNPNSLYYDKAIKAKQIVEESRTHVANLFGVIPNNVLFTSGATESNNMVIKGLTILKGLSKGHIITSKTEHSSVNETLRYLESMGYEVTYLDVDSRGIINTEELKKSFREETILVTIMWVNNETGAINPISEIAEICLAKKVPFHTDATQAVGKLNCDISSIRGLSFLSMSAHKIYGPKGIGALIVKDFGYKISPLIHGGEQEKGLRGGTLPTHQIIGLGEASRICLQDLTKNMAKLHESEIQLKITLRSIYKDSLTILNDFTPKINGIISVRFIGVNNQILLKTIANEIAASSGAACSNSKPSHVLKAMGYSDETIRETIRLSISPYEDYGDFSQFQ